MLRRTFTTLREPRYLALSIAMVVVALACVGAGTWQIARFDLKVHENDALRTNDRAPAVPVSALLPVVGRPAPSADAVRLRSVTATGRYDLAAQRFVRLRSVGGHEGYYVLTPLRTPTAVLLVVRGFVAGTADGNPPTTVAAPPTGTVTVHGRVQTAESPDDRPAGLPATQLRSINPSDQAARLHAAVYDGYVTLEQHAPGTAGLTTIPPPSLSNPAGGAVEPQHFAYIIQWYLFALLALAAPVVMARAEQREQRHDDELAAAEPAEPVGPAESASAEPLAVEPGGSVEPAPSEDERRAAKLASRYGKAVR